MPLLEEGGVEAFLRREVLPYAPGRMVRAVQRQDRLRDQLSPATSTSPSRYAPYDDIRADILALERETEGLLSEIVG